MQLVAFFHEDFLVKKDSLFIFPEIRTVEKSNAKRSNDILTKIFKIKGWVQV